jgi:hypothetical protein
MTAKEALWLVKVQISNTEQNQEAIQVLEGLVNLANIHIDDEPQTLEHLFGDIYTLEEAKKLLDIDDGEAYQLYGTEAQHVKNHMATVAARELKRSAVSLAHTKAYEEATGRSCARYDLVEEDDA